MKTRSSLSPLSRALLAILASSTASLGYAQTSPLASSGPLALLSPVSSNVQELRLFAQTSAGISTRAFNSSSRTWSASSVRSLPSAAQINSQLLGFNYNTAPSVGTEYQLVYSNQPSWLFADRYLVSSLFPSVSAPPIESSNILPPWTFFPRNLLLHNYPVGSREFNIFGIDRTPQSEYLPSLAPSVFNIPLPRDLREAYVTANGTSFTNHGNPYPGSSSRILMGNHAAVMRGTDALVATTVTASNNVNATPVVFCRVYTPTNGWQWLNRETPPGVTVLRSPLAVLQRYQINSVTFDERIHVFVVGLVSGSGAGSQPWHLFRRTLTAGSWSSWVDMGVPPGVGTGGGINGVPGGYSLTAAYMRGSFLQLAGHTDLGDQVVTFSSSWPLQNFAATNTWATHPLPASRATARLLVGSVTELYLTPSNTRQSVFVRLNNGEVWERFNDSVLGGGWRWEQRF